MTFEEIRDTLIVGGKARRPNWGTSYVKFSDTNQPNHTKLIRGSTDDSLKPVILDVEDFAASDWVVVP